VREGAPLLHTHELTPAGAGDSAEQRFRIDLKPGLAGMLDYRIRAYPRHELLTHPFEMGLSTWV
jgi:starch phosphorylase